MNNREKKFVALVKDFYKQNGRHDLPWRHTTDPYLILVSEIMLQQTQVERVIPKYQVFITTYPTVQTLALASLRDVLILWQGLGYNRRAKSLHEAARHIVERFSGVFPTTRDEILSLPGVGPYTAGAVMAFAFNQAEPIIETNIRTAYLHHFFPLVVNVHDTQIMPLITTTLDTQEPRTWYYALMDYGSHLKKTLPNPSKRSVHHTKQTTFEGSNRQIRGAIIKVLGEQKQAITLLFLKKLLPTYDGERIEEQLRPLVSEQLIIKIKNSYQLPI